MRTDPFRELDRLTQHARGTGVRPALMPMDAYRADERFVVHLDLPGVDASTIDLTVENDVLTVSAERQWQASEDEQVIAWERPQGTFSRQLVLGATLDADHLEASYEHGVLTLTIPVAEQAKPRRIPISAGHDEPTAIDAPAMAS